MKKISVEKNVAPEKLGRLGVDRWPVWEKEASEFPWSYDSDETCYILSGEVVVTPDDGEPVTIVTGDLVTFPRGMSCRWDIRKKIRKHYQLS
jgi:uncharacterized cupin superfamily protein